MLAAYAPFWYVYHIAILLSWPGFELFAIYAAVYPISINNIQSEMLIVLYDTSSICQYKITCSI